MDSMLIKYLTKKGFAVDESMNRHISTWKSWYKGDVEGFHNYTVFNGIKTLSQKRLSLQLGKSICETLANLLFNERCAIAIQDKATDIFVKDIFDKNNIYVKINECQERKSAIGTLAYIPYWTKEGIKFNFINADRMIPLSWENNIVNELCVYSKSTSRGREYLFVQLFLLKSNGTYSIENLLLEADENNSAYMEANFSKIPGYENVKKTIYTNSTVKPFVIDRLNIANNINIDSPLGVSAFANAIDTMRLIDTIYDSYCNEFILGKKRIMVAPEALNAQTGQPVFDPNELVYYQLPEGVSKDDTPFIHEIDMTIRATEHEGALHNSLNMFSSQVGLGETFYRYNTGNTSTATQIISENNTLFRTLKKHEILLEAVIVDLVRLIIDIGIRHGEKNLNPDTDITVSFDDSIIEDKAQEITRRLAEVSSGILRPEVYLAWRYGVTEKEALKLMPGEPSTQEEGIQ